MPSTEGKVAVIGAGPLGLLSLKTFIEDGWDATSFETRDYVGGLWKDSNDSTLSVIPTTIFNSSKSRAALSDFPFPEDTDDYPTAPQLHKYWEDYATDFELRRHIHLGTKVIGIERTDQKWALRLECKATQEQRTEHFDKVCVATGAFYRPRYAKLNGLETFKGRVLHSIDFHDASQFKDQNVLLIGMHATAQDITNALVPHTRKVFMAHRNGLLLIPRYTPSGETFDVSVTLKTTFFLVWAWTWFPRLINYLIDMAVSSTCRKAFPNIPKSWGLEPFPSLTTATPLMADALWPAMSSGAAEPVAPVSEITPDKITLTSGRVLTEIDTIIFCTGYHIDIPSNLVCKSTDPNTPDPFNPYINGATSPPTLYRNTFPMHPDTDIQNSIALMGHGAIALPGFVMFEMQAQAVSQVWQGKQRLPDVATMQRWTRGRDSWRRAELRRSGQREDSTFYPAFLSFPDHFRWLDQASGSGIFANLYGWLNWRAWWIWAFERRVWRAATSGLLSSTIFRLFDEGGRKPLPRSVALGIIEEEKRRVGVRAAMKRAEIEKKEISVHS